MKFEDFKKLKTEIGNKNFYTNYQGFSKVGVGISYLGNLFSILFAYFYVSKIIYATVINPSGLVSALIVLVSIVILMMLELTKRFVFDKFSQSIIKDKYKFKDLESVILGFICICLISASFYLSLNGAEKYADKSDDIKQNTTQLVDNYSDSLNKKYDVKISELEKQNVILFQTNQGYETRLTTLSTQYNDGTLSNQDLKRVKIEMNQIRKDKESNTINIDKNESKIKEIKTEKDSEISKFESKKSDTAEKDIKKSSDNPFIFLVFSTIIEFVILFGIWFINYYKIRSVEDYEKLISKDSKYKAFNNWVEFLNMVYSNDSKIGDYIPFKTEIVKLIKSNNIDISPKELDEMIKVMVHIKLLKAKGSRKSIAMTKEDSLEAIKNHFKID